jgi:hypothetical protein
MKEQQPVPPANSKSPTAQFLLFITIFVLAVVVIGQISTLLGRQYSLNPTTVATPSHDVRDDASNDRNFSSNPSSEQLAQADVARSRGAANPPTKESANSDQLCTEQNTKRGELDWGMYSYCLDLERRGYDKLVAINQKYRRLNWFEDAQNYAVTRWTKRGMRSDNMVAYELDRIVDGFEDLQYEAKQPSFDQRKYYSCEQQWKFNFEMVNYCYKN